MTNVNGFVNRVVARHIGGLVWELTEPLYYFRSCGGIRDIVPSRFRSDGGSIPRALWAIVGPPQGGGPGMDYCESAWLHDYYYQSHILPRDEADAEFSEALTCPEQSVSAWRRVAMYRAVRLFGGAAYDQWAKRQRVLSTAGGAR